MKFISKEEQKRLDSHIRNLQKKVTELQDQLSAAQAATAKAQATAQVQSGSNAKESVKAQLDAANKALADTKALLETKAKELTVAQAAVAKAKQDSEAAVAAAKAEATAQVQSGNKAQESVTVHLDAANKALAESKAQLEVKTKELTVLKANLDKQVKQAQQTEAQYQDSVKENELLLLQLMQAQEELVEHFEQKNEFEKLYQAATAKIKEQDAATQTAQATSKAQLEATQKALKDKQAQLDAKVKELEANTKELATTKAESIKAKQDSDAAHKAFADIKAKLETHAKELSTLKTERDKQAKLAQQPEAKYQDSAQENELLLLQLMQAQEELVEYYEQKSEFEKLYQAYKARWERLEKRLPNYLDFGAINIVDVDGLSDVPSIIWQVKDFAQAGVALSEFSFVTVLQDGHPGIGLVKDGLPHTFVPKLLSSDKEHLAIFMGLGNTEFKQLTAAITILGQLEAGQWLGFEFPTQFDLGFWRPSIKVLLGQLKQLPAMLRYDAVRLKRELINPDYEHLWLEFHGLSLGPAQWKKFEIRLGAALVQTDGFSQYPKFEIPLIDGKTKPFDSWYAESQDDSGAKLELRFALDKNVFDVAVWSKLLDTDKALVLRIIYAMPEALRRLEKQKTAIHRSWSTWIDFATAAVKVLDVNKTAAKLSAAPQQVETSETVNPAKPLPAAAEQAQLPAPTKLTSTGAKAGKVISITSKPVAKGAAKSEPPPKSTSKKTQAAAKPAAKTPRKTKA